MARGMEQLRQDIGMAKEAVYSWGFPKIVDGIEQRVLPAIVPTFPKEFDENFLGKLEEDGVPIVVFNHQAHADGFAALQVAKHLIEKSKDPDGIPQIKGFILPIATTIRSGHQKGTFLKDFVTKAREIALSYGVQVEDYIRDKDIKLINDSHIQHPNISKNANIGLARMLLKAAKNGYGIMLFPEGTVEGGRTYENGQIKGMQPFQEEIIDPAARMIQRVGKQPFYVPVGIHGTNKLQHVDKGNKPSLSLILGAMLHEQFLPNVSVRVGESVWQDELEASSFPIAYALGERTAQLTRAENRGHYGNVFFVDA